METTEGYIIIQMGITAFCLNEEDETFSYKSYNFYVLPQSYTQTYECQASSMSFLSEHNFDFNKLFREGISYCNRVEWKKLKEELTNKKESLLTSGGIDWGDEASIPDEEKELLEKIR